MEILVTGGTGFIGRHLAATLLDQGHTLRLLGRNFSLVQPLLERGAQPIQADLRDYNAVVSACQGVDAVYHVGALSAPWGPRSLFYDINVAGTAAVIDGSRRAGAKRLIYVSSPSVLFDGRDQRNLTDDAPYPKQFMSTYSWSKKIGEELVRAAHSLDSVIIRPKAVFGPGDQSLLPRLTDAARRGKLPQIGDGTNLVDLTYVQNVVDALILALDAPAAVGQTYTITNDEHIRLWDVVNTVLQAQGLASTLRVLPIGVVLAAARAMELRATLLGGEPLLTRYTTLILGRTQTYDISAARRDLGYQPRISVAEGIRLTLAEEHRS